MKIEHLSLTNFRNYARLEHSFSNGITLLHGANAQGKTNLLESIYYLATTKSPYTSTDQQIINWQANQPEELIVVSRILAQISNKRGTSQVELRLIKEIKNGTSSFRREALVNRKKVRLIDLLGNVRVVLFLPTDMELITGSPSSRRRYLDISLCQLDAVYCRALSTYNKVLEQRNAALKQVAITGKSREIISILDEKLIKAGTIVFARRAAYMNAISQVVSDIHYEYLTNQSETLVLGYLPRLSDKKFREKPLMTPEHLEHQAWLLSNLEDQDEIAKRFLENLTLALSKDISSGTTSVGPHRDDWAFWINGYSLADFGSRGQQRTAILSFKLAEARQMFAETGDNPVLLLDDVIAELDANRRKWLLDFIDDQDQIVVTSTELDAFSDQFVEKADLIAVQNGHLITPASFSESQNDID